MTKDARLPRHLLSSQFNVQKLKEILTRCCKPQKSFNPKPMHVHSIAVYHDAANIRTRRLIHTDKQDTYPTYSLPGHILRNRRTKECHGYNQKAQLSRQVLKKLDSCGKAKTKVYTKTQRAVLTKFAVQTWTVWHAGPIDFAFLPPPEYAILGGYDSYSG